MTEEEEGLSYFILRRRLKSHVLPPKRLVSSPVKPNLCHVKGFFFVCKARFLHS